MNIQETEQELKEILTQRTQRNKGKEQAESFKALIQSLPFGVSIQWIYRAIIGRVSDRRQYKKINDRLRQLIRLSEGKKETRKRYFKEYRTIKGNSFYIHSCEVLHFITF